MVIKKTRDGKVVERLAAGFVRTQKEFDKYIDDMREDVKDNDTGYPLFFETWKYLYVPSHPTRGRRRSPPFSINGVHKNGKSKMLVASTNKRK